MWKNQIKGKLSLFRPQAYPKSLSNDYEPFFQREPKIQFCDMLNL